MKKIINKLLGKKPKIAKDIKPTEYCFWCDRLIKADA